MTRSCKRRYIETNQEMKSIWIFFGVCIFWNTPMTAQLSGNEFTYTDLQTLCKTLGTEKTIVGLGESTHGTKEFTSIRAEVVKNLVTQYHYRAFILEADYAPCEKINQYLSTGNGDISSLLVDLRLWPWIHEDFLKLLIWLKDYNLQNPLQKVQFYGMDSQYSRIFATKDAILLQYPDWGRQLFEIVEGKEEPKVKITKLRSFDAQMVEGSDTIDLQRHYYVDIRVVSCYDLRKKYYLNSIGAVYVAQPGKINSFYSKIEKNKEYDYLVVSPKSSAINVLPQYFNK